MPTELPKEENSYILDSESATEMARLMSQSYATTMGGAGGGGIGCGAKIPGYAGGWT